MKMLNFLVAAGLAAIAGGAFADSSVQTSQVNAVSDIDGRANVMTMQSSGPVMSRPADEVMPGPMVEDGAVPRAVQEAATEVNQVLGHS